MKADCLCLDEWQRTNQDMYDVLQKQGLHVKNIVIGIESGTWCYFITFN